MILPPELIIQIINHNVPRLSLFESISPKRTTELLTYSLVNTTWNSIAQVLLYRDISISLESVRSLLEVVKKKELEDELISLQICTTSMEEKYSEESLKFLRELLITCKQVRSISFCDVHGINGKDLSVALNLESLRLDAGGLKNNYYYPLPSLRNLSISSVSSFYHPTIIPSLQSLEVNFSELRAVSSFFGILGSSLECLAVSHYQFRAHSEKSEKVAWQSLSKLKILSITPRPNQARNVLEAGLLNILNRIPGRLESLHIPLIRQMFLPLHPFLDLSCLVNLRLIVVSLILTDEVEFYAWGKRSTFSTRVRRRQLELASKKESWKFRWEDDTAAIQPDGVLFWELVELREGRGTNS